MLFIPLLLIPICALLNHLGGQSVVIPVPRFTCRMIGQGLALGIVAYFAHFPMVLSAWLAGVGVAGFSFWAVWKWGPGFMTITGQDHRAYTTQWWTTHYWICKVCDYVEGISAADTTLTLAQCLGWGECYMTVRGLFLLPFFAALAYFLTPWALIIGFAGLAQGIIYRTSPSVLIAEWKMGAWIGAMLALTLILYMLPL